jgi:hypothetical protein
MADKPLAIRVCLAWMPDPSLQGCIHGVPIGKGLVCLPIRTISYPLNGDPDQTMTMAGFGYAAKKFSDHIMKSPNIAVDYIPCL